VWAVAFVSVGGLWMLGVALPCSVIIWRTFHCPPAVTSASKPEEFKAILELHKTATDQFRDSLNFAFDLMVTKTILPLITLLPGYLFGSKKS